MLFYELSNKTPYHSKYSSWGDGFLWCIGKGLLFSSFVLATPALLCYLFSESILLCLERRRRAKVCKEDKEKRQKRKNDDKTKLEIKKI